MALVLSLVAVTGACTKRSAAVGAAAELRPSRGQLQATSALSSRVSKLLRAGLVLQDPLFDLAPQFGAALAAFCEATRCESLQLVPLFPAGEGLLARPKVIAAGAQHDLPPVFVRERAQLWELLDEMPPAIE